MKCKTGTTYFISCASRDDTMIFSSSALCIQMLELMRYFRSEHVRHGKRTKEYSRIKLLSYCLLPDKYVLVVKQEVDNGIELFCDNINEALSSYYQALFKTQTPVFSKHPIVTEILNKHELFSALRHVNLMPLNQDGVREMFDGGDYPWSSYHELVQKRQNPVVDDVGVTKMFGGRSQFRQFIRTGVYTVPTSGF